MSTASRLSHRPHEDQPLAENTVDRGNDAAIRKISECGKKVESKRVMENLR
jgi:hypothetical protein